MINIYRVQRRVKVAQPEEERGDTVADLAGGAERHRQCHHEEGQPADNEGARYNCQGFGCFPFTFRLQRLFAFVHLLHGIRYAGQLLCRLLL